MTTPQEDLEREAFDYYCGLMLNSGNAHRVGLAVATYKAGHQSAERKSAAHIDHLQNLCRELVGDPAGYDDKLIEETKAELRKTREMVRELVGALEFYGKGGNSSRDVWEHEELGYFTGKRARELLTKYADQIAALDRREE